MKKIIVLIGCSACGKSTLMTRYLDLHQGMFKQLKSVTSRTKRGDNDNDYKFVSKDQFLDLLENDKLIEHSEHLGAYYGILDKDVNQDQNHLICALTYGGYLDLKKIVGDRMTGVFIENPSEQIVNKRLIDRGSSKEEIEMRLETVRKQDYSDKLTYKIKQGSKDDMFNQLCDTIFDIISKENN